MMKEQLGEKAAWVKVVERCERSRRACAIRARPMFPTEIWKKVESNGWGLPRPLMQGAIGNWFGRRTAIPLPGLPRISIRMDHGTIWIGLGRKPPGAYRSGAGCQLMLRDGSGKDHAHDGRRRKLVRGLLKKIQ